MKRTDSKTEFVVQGTEQDMEMRGFRWLGWAMVAILIAGLAYTFASGPLWRPLPWSVDLSSSAFEGASLPKEEIDKVLVPARARVEAINNFGAWLKLVGELSGWFSFACTSAITLLLGYHGRQPNAPGQPADTSGLSVRIVRTIGLLAALAAVLTAGGTMAINGGHERFERADRGQKLIREAERVVSETKTTQTEKRDALDELAHQIVRL